LKKGDRFEARREGGRRRGQNMIGEEESTRGKGRRIGSVVIDQ
jgi:hypothetical protein